MKGTRVETEGGVNENAWRVSVVPDISILNNNLILLAMAPRMRPAVFACYSFMVLRDASWSNLPFLLVRVTEIWDKERKTTLSASIHNNNNLRFAAPEFKAMFTRAAGHPAGELESKWDKSEERKVN